MPALVRIPLKQSKIVEMDPPTEEQFFLTVDYSGAAPTALFADENCSVFEYRCVQHDTHLGADALFNVEADDEGLVQALRGITKLPLEDGNGAGIKTINAVVLLSDHAYDLNLGAALEEALHEP